MITRAQRRKAQEALDNLIVRAGQARLSLEGPLRIADLRHLDRTFQALHADAEEGHAPIRAAIVRTAGTAPKGF